MSCSSDDNLVFRDFAMLFWSVLLLCFSGVLDWSLQVPPALHIATVWEVQETVDLSHCCCGGCCHHCPGWGRSSGGADSGRSGLLLPKVWGWPHRCFSWDSTGKREDGFLHRPFWSWCWAGVDLPVRSLLDCSFASPLARNSRLYFFFFFLCLLAVLGCGTLLNPVLQIWEGKRKSRNSIWHLSSRLEIPSQFSFFVLSFTVILSSPAQFLLVYKDVFTGEAQGKMSQEHLVPPYIFQILYLSFFLFFFFFQ